MASRGGRGAGGGGGGGSCYLCGQGGHMARDCPQRGQGGARGGRGGAVGGGGAPRQAPLGPNVAGDMELLRNFFLTHKTPGTTNDTPYYAPIFNEVSQRTRTRIPFSLEALSRHSDECRALAVNITNNVLSSIDDIVTVAQSLVPPGPDGIDADVVDTLVREFHEAVPALLTRRFEIELEPMEEFEKFSFLRDLKASNAGKLLVIRGVCVSASPVRSMVRVHTSLCEMCSGVVFVEVAGDKFVVPTHCTSARCRGGSRNAGYLRSQYKACRLVSYQEVRLQEMRIDVPLGSLPRTIKVVCEGEMNCGVAIPGSMITILGALVPDLSHNATKKMSYGDCQVSLIIRAVKCTPQKVDYSTFSGAETALALKRLRVEDDDATRIQKVLNSIAPEIFGLQDIKKVVLCLLAGGDSVLMKDGMRIRGDINILFTGDPGVAKSQILKWVSNIAPRGVFTSGQGSSGVGLTAAVVQDPVTGENVLEPGTLVFADKGVCAIDEFDKMNETDRTALHEVMEQQTISIAKAGIITTMNCRAAILAASNPQWGRWNSMKTPMENINIPTALFSRFDVVWVIRDRYDAEDDKNLATHVALVHTSVVKTAASDGMEANRYDRDTLRAYLGDIKTVQPIFTDSSTRLVTDLYLLMRKEGANGFVVTTRNLLGIMRLSRALARLRYSATIDDVDVKEASRLLELSRASLTERREIARRGPLLTSDVYTLLREFYEAQRGKSLRRGDTVVVTESRDALRRQGVTDQLLRDTIDMYHDLKVWSRGAAYDVLHILSDV